MDQEYYLTKEKHKELSEELEYLRNTRRKEIAENLEYAKSLGDLSENAEYHEARQNQAETEARIRELETKLKYATIVSHKKTDTIEIGSEVTVRRNRSKKKIKYTIAGSEESDMAAGKISYTSPLGSALLGNKKGDKVTLSTPGGEVTYTIDKVE
ncbi:MAG: transcription elongation factor GreA [Candidatus Paceibacterota bacterium]